jgi:hypothetical protein
VAGRRAKALATGRLLSAAMQKERLRWVPVPGSPGSRTKYGLALFDAAGYLGHNGELPGFQSFMGYQPHQGRTIVVLTNLATPQGTGPADAFATIIVKELAATSPRSTTNPNAVPSAAQGDFAGRVGRGTRRTALAYAAVSPSVAVSLGGPQRDMATLDEMPTTKQLSDRWGIRERIRSGNGSPSARRFPAR